MAARPEERPDEHPDEGDWMLDGLCRGANPSDFFPSDGLGVEAAQRVCALCPVRSECLEYALAHRIEHGVWGGASERERRRILRRRRLAREGSGPARSEQPARSLAAVQP